MTQDEESDSEFYKGEMRNSLSMDNCVYQVEEEEEEEKEEEGQVYFSNQEYYWRLEELKKTHLRNMAEMEKMYIGRSEGGQQHYQHGLGLGGGGIRWSNPTSLLPKGWYIIQVNAPVILGHLKYFFR